MNKEDGIKTSFHKIKQGFERLPWTGIFWGNVWGLLVVGFSLHCGDGKIQEWLVKLRHGIFFPLTYKVLGGIVKEPYLYGIVVWILLPFYCGFWGGLVEWGIKKGWRNRKGKTP